MTTTVSEFTEVLLDYVEPTIIENIIKISPLQYTDERNLFIKKNIYLAESGLLLARQTDTNGKITQQARDSIQTIMTSIENYFKIYGKALYTIDAETEANATAIIKTEFDTSNKNYAIYFNGLNTDNNSVVDLYFYLPYYNANATTITNTLLKINTVSIKAIDTIIKNFSAASDSDIVSALTQLVTDLNNLII